MFANRASPKSLASALAYTSQGNRRDEALSPDGAVEPEWYDLFESINRHGLDTLIDWKTVAARISRERGLAYRPASLDESNEKGWTLGPIPWIISPERWAVFEAGISQRCCPGFSRTNLCRKRPFRFPFWTRVGSRESHRREQSFATPFRTMRYSANRSIFHGLV